MLEMICTIPENIGWMMVGIAGTLCAVALVALGKTIVEAIKARKDYKGSGNPVLVGCLRAQSADDLPGLFWGLLMDDDDEKTESGLLTED